MSSLQSDGVEQREIKMEVFLSYSHRDEDLRNELLTIFSHTPGRGNS